MAWLEEEEKRLIREIRNKKPNPPSNKYLLFLAILMAIIAFPHMSLIHSHPSNPMPGRFFPDTWICKRCGYDNYEGIHRCAVCGTEKGKS
ncbi:MAG TPA: hypothetical protein VKZ95_08705 [Sphingobacteriaceae bacterium]|nr:hypothetical protein [Sphingobacteriaceae bacterium]